MVWVNLLPWRQAALYQRWRLWRLVGGALLLMLFVLLLKGYWQRNLNHQQSTMLGLMSTALRDAQILSERTEAAQQQLSKLQLKQEALERRQRQMMQWHHFALTLGSHFPPDVWLNALFKTPQSLEFKGEAASILHLNQLQEKLRKIALFDQVKLGPIQRVRHEGVSFVMQARLNRAVEADE